MTAELAVRHFFSHVTRVSIELPVGFDQVGEDDFSVSYADRSSGSEQPASVRVRVVGTVDPAGRWAAVHALGDGFAALDGVVYTRREHEVDDDPAETVVLRRPDSTLLHQTAAAADARLIAVVAVAPDESYLPTYDAAVESIRFVAL